LIWRTTEASWTALIDFDEFVWQSGQGSGERQDWLARIGRDFSRNAKQSGFEMHADIETVFETLEVVWPKEIVRRIRLVTPHLDRGIALLHRLNGQRSKTEGLEAILARIQTAVLTVDSAMALGFCNPAGEAQLRRGDGLLVKNGRLAARWQARAEAHCCGIQCMQTVYRSGLITRANQAAERRHFLVAIRRDGINLRIGPTFSPTARHSCHSG
jgi:hypothetical protein